MARSNSNQGGNKTADAQQSGGLQASEAGAAASAPVGQVDTRHTGAQPGPDSPPTLGTPTDTAESQAGATAGDQQGVTVLGLESQADGASDSGEPDAATVVALGDGEGTLVTIYPLRSYLDGKEIRRAGGQGYKSAKHDAVSLIAAGLATDKNPKA